MEYILCTSSGKIFDTMSICIKKFDIKKSVVLGNGSCVNIVNFSCLLSDIKGIFCAIIIIVQLWFGNSMQ